MRDQPSVQELLAAHADGALNQEESERVERYLQENGPARVARSELEHTIEAVRSLKPEPPAPDWSAMEASIGQALERARDGSPAPKVLNFRARLGLGLAMAAGLLIAALLLRPEQPQVRPAPSAPSWARSIGSFGDNFEQWPEVRALGRASAAELEATLRYLEQRPG